jgi:hypothetical protein
MQDTPTPRELHDAAVIEAAKHPDTDPRSESYQRVNLLIAIDRDHEVIAGMRWEFKWAGKMADYEEFWRQTEKAPRQKGGKATPVPEAELRLGTWARDQRRFEGRLCRFQLARLDVSPAFVWDPRQKQWDKNLEAISDFVEKRKNLPRLISQDQDQLKLARWLGRQLAALRENTMLDNRRGPFIELLAHAEKLKSERPEDSEDD